MVEITITSLLPKEHRFKRLWTLVLTTSPPLIALILLTVVVLSESLANYSQSRAAHNSLLRAGRSADVITELEYERGLACLQMSAKYSTSLNMTALMHERAEQLKTTDIPVALFLADSNGDIVDTVGVRLANVRLVVDRLIEHDGVNTCEVVLTPYTELIRQLVNSMQEQSALDGMGNFALVLMARDYWGLARARGAEFFANDRYNVTSLVVLMDTVPVAEHMYDVAIGSDAALLAERKRRLGTKGRLEILVNELKQSKVEKTELKAAGIHRKAIALEWFDLVTEHMAYISTVSTYLWRTADTAALARGQRAFIRMVCISILSFITAIVCPILLFFYIRQVTILWTEQVEKTEALKMQETHTRRQRQKTELLFNHAYPALNRVAKECKCGAGATIGAEEITSNLMKQMWHIRTDGNKNAQLQLC